MNSLDFLINISSSIIMMFVIVYIWHSLLDRKMNFKSIKNYIVILLLSIISIYNYFIVNEFLRIISITLILCIAFLIIFKEKINNKILTPIFTQLIFMISEVVFAFGLIFILREDPNNFVPQYFGKFLTNIVIILIAFIISKLPFIKKFFRFLLRITDKIKSNALIILLMILMIAANILASILYYDFNFAYIMIFNTILTIICFIIVINSLYNKNKLIKTYDKYNTTLNSLKEYEEILNRYRVSNHENKNQLLTIRNMIPKSSKKTLNYIDTIINNKLKDNDKVMMDASKIPEGGLRGLIYSKMLIMYNLGINYELEVSRDLKTTYLIEKIDSSTMLDICKIIGVYIDNSIQAVEKLDDKHILIEMYLNKKYLEICISNNYTGMIDIDKLEEIGYTSKGKNHGYGLTLAKEIIDNNKKLTNEKRISGNIFTQVLKIKM